MGRVTYCLTRTGANINDAYNSAYEDAEEEYGHQEGYSGTINSADSSNLVNVTNSFKASKKELFAFIEDYTDKHDDGVFYIEIEKPIPNTAKIKSQVDVKPQKGTRKWVTKYEVVHNINTIITTKNSQTEAIKAARAWSETNKKRCHVNIIKVIDNGSNHVASIQYKPSSKEKPGRYALFGWARE